jgi:hypothetical protein
MYPLDNQKTYKNWNDRGFYYIRAPVDKWIAARPDAKIAKFIEDNNISHHDFLIKIGISERSLKIRLNEHRTRQFKGSGAMIMTAYPLPPHMACVLENVANHLMRQIRGDHVKRIFAKEDFYILNAEYTLSHEMFLDNIRLDLSPIISLSEKLNAIFTATPTLLPNHIMTTPAVNRKRRTRQYAEQHGEPISFGGYDSPTKFIK